MPLSKKDRDILSDIASESGKLLSLFAKRDPSKKNAMLDKAIGFQLLHVERLYRKLGGRFVKEVGADLNMKLKEISKEIETDASTVPWKDISYAITEIVPQFKKKIEDCLEKDSNDGSVN